MQGTIARIVLGFIAAAISVLIVHEGIIYLLAQAGLVDLNRLPVWSLRPVRPWDVPTIGNRVFWGGLWGILFALLYDWIPGGMAWLKGLIYGLLIVVISNWILLPLVRGRYFGVGETALFADYNVQRMLITVAIVGSFGLGLGIIYGLIGRRQA